MGYWTASIEIFQVIKQHNMIKMHCFAYQLNRGYHSMYVMIPKWITEVVVKQTIINHMSNLLFILVENSA